MAAFAAEEFKVGGYDGWRQPSTNESEMYSHWASKQRFHIGDSLGFEYKNDSVLMVDKWGYYHCNLSHPISVFKDRNTVVNLERPGPVYFVSRDPDHCKNGQRLMVEVIVPYRSPQPYMDASPGPAPAPFSGAGSFSVVQELVFLYVFVIAVSINM
ncbi:hypothetical protein CDL12_11906 [Handroanthus impetiginosus]|uniref:Phytocyanin domain-containing protein n=1 Tax=Handroanthus impetiginosus TaxID=429701 RepID=A0A2G9HD30_9LAMI|nr:hypothetical protein CDL12_11906 [Handroanthus impetiginosus]